MKTRFLILSLLVPAISFAQTYTVDWHKIAGGGGTSTSGTYQVSGTIGQPDAGVAMSGGPYSVTGGFWALIHAVQTPGLPNLVILPNGTGSVQVLWPATGSYTLQQNASLTSTNWVTSGYLVTSANGTNHITIASPTGNLFFRLKQ